MIERAIAAASLAAAEIERSGAWAADGSLSMAACLRNRGRLSRRDAARLLREGRVLARYDTVADAAINGRLSGGQTSAIRAVVPSDSAELFDLHQRAVVDAIEGVDVAASERVCQSWGERTDLDAAFQTARQFDGAGDARSAARRNADAIVEILAFFNKHHASDGTPRHRPHVELSYRADDLTGLAAPHAVTSEGQLLPGWAAEAYLYDCVTSSGGAMTAKPSSTTSSCCAATTTI